VHGNTLALEKRKAYRTGFDLTGFVREIPIEDCPAPTVRSVAAKPTADHATLSYDEPDTPRTQLDLF
jgi:hypothetical protein